MEDLRSYITDINDKIYIAYFNQGYCKSIDLNEFFKDEKEFYFNDSGVLILYGKFDLMSKSFECIKSKDDPYKYILFIVESKTYECTKKLYNKLLEKLNKLGLDKKYIEYNNCYNCFIYNINDIDPKIINL